MMYQNCVELLTDHVGELRGLMGVKDFCAAITPGSKITNCAGPGCFKVLKGPECGRSADIFETQKVATSPHGGVLNQVS